MFLYLLVALGLATAPPAPVPSVAGPVVPAVAKKVYVTPLTVGPEASPAVVSVLQEKLLSSSRVHRGYSLLGATDLQRMLDADAVRTSLDCNAESCFSEIADAVGAPELITGQLGRIGDTWLLSLSRIRREDMSVVTRVSRETRGDSPEGLLSQTDSMMNELLLGVALPVESSGSMVVPLGGITLAAGAVLAAAGAGVLGYFALDYANNVDATNTYKGQAAEFKQWQQDGNTGQLVGGILVFAGGLVAIAGASILVVGLVGEEP